MRAVRYHLSLLRYGLQLLLGRRFPGVYYRAPFACVRAEDIPAPALPGPGWVRIRPILAGICGSDMGTVMGKNSPALSPFVSFPAVLGHELVGRITEIAGEEAVGVADRLPVAPVRAALGANGELRPGDRVVVDPALGCVARGLAPCPACQRGEAYLCERNTEGSFAPGLILGFCRDLPGSWAEEMVAPAAQVFRVPDEVSDEKAVLIEPFAVALRAVLRGLPRFDGQAGEKILIIGGGTIGLATLAALRLLELEMRVSAAPVADITVVARHQFQQQVALQLGASRVVRGDSDLVRVAEELGGARAYRPVIGPPVYTGGFDLVYDCIGSHRTIDQSLRLTRGGGRIVLVGAAGQLPGLDWSFVWSRELTIIGSAGYGREHRLPPALATLAAAAAPDQGAGPAQGVAPAPHTFALALELLRRHPSYPLERLITHRFPLSAWREALAVNVRHGPHRAIKSVFTFDR
ncbi:MAG: zinc-binding dehydrogenase [Limnochordales bacterium]|nr:zinc-binding dehydrogenase [Limnochordales bacterium]